MKLHVTDDKKRKSGFTLIELLVVIAIIAILAAILFPVFARARENARKTACLNNLKQIGIGIMQYTQDYDETFPQYAEIPERLVPGAASFSPSDPVIPPTTNPTTPGQMFHFATQGKDGFIYSWMDYVYPYIKSLEVFKCPSRQFPWVNAAGNKKYWPQLAYSGIISSYTDPSKVTKVASINGASGKIFALHGRLQAYGYINPGEFNSYLDSYATATGDSKARIENMFPHLDGQIILFCDGHAKYASHARLKYWLCQTSDFSAAQQQIGDVSATNTTGCGFWYPLSPPQAS